MQTFNYMLADALLPPAPLILATAVGIFWRRRRPLAGSLLIIGSLGSLLALSTLAVAYPLMRSLEVPPLAPGAAAGGEAIVILGGGRQRGAPEWNGETVSDFTLARLRYGAHLARTTGLPVLVTGGRSVPAPAAEADLMRDVLENEFGVPVRWHEDRSRTTEENAQASAMLLNAAGVHKVVLVTSAFHMRRARGVFEREGFAVIAAPTGYYGQRPFAADLLIPQAGALRISHLALREWLANLLYRLRAD